MNLMVNPVITDFRQDVNGDIKMLKLGANKEDAYANIIEQGASAKLDNNKTATIDVSTYTEPVVITPTSGKDGMKKATITLSNIPSGGEYKSVAEFEDYNSYDLRLVFFETTDYPPAGSTVNVLVVNPDFEGSEKKIQTGEDYIMHEGPATITTADAGCGELRYTVGWVGGLVQSRYKWTPEP